MGDAIEIFRAASAVRDVGRAHGGTTRASTLRAGYAAVTLSRTGAATRRGSAAQARGLRTGQRVIARGEVAELAAALRVLLAGLTAGAELVSDGDVSGNGFPVPVADSNGNLTVVWSQAGPPNFDVYSARRPLGADAGQSPQQLSVSAPRPYSNFAPPSRPMG